MVWCRVHGFEVECNSEMCKDCVFEGRCQDDDLFCPEEKEELDDYGQW